MPLNGHLNDPADTLLRFGRRFRASDNTSSRQCVTDNIISRLVTPWFESTLGSHEAVGNTAESGI